MGEEAMKQTRLPERMRHLDLEEAFDAHAPNTGGACWLRSQTGGFAKR